MEENKKFEEQIEAIAKVCHETNRAYCATLGVEKPSWERSSGHHQTATKRGIMKVIERPGITPCQLHEDWCDHMWNTGWEYGDFYDEESKKHPCLVRYGYLPASEKLKDYLFLNIVRAFLSCAKED